MLRRLGSRLQAMAGATALRVSIALAACVSEKRPIVRRAARECNLTAVATPPNKTRVASH